MVDDDDSCAQVGFLTNLGVVVLPTCSTACVRDAVLGGPSGAAPSLNGHLRDSSGGVFGLDPDSMITVANTSM
jgi:hypothetical protein